MWLCKLFKIQVNKFIQERTLILNCFCKLPGSYLVYNLSFFSVLALLLVLLKRCHHRYIQCYPWFLAWGILQKYFSPMKVFYKIFQVAERQMLFYCVPLPPKWTFQVYLLILYQGSHTHIKQFVLNFFFFLFLSFLGHSYRYMCIVFFI